MNWLLCPRSTLDAVTSERDRLRKQNDDLTDQLVRLARTEAGLREVAADKKPKPEPWPDDIVDYLQGYESKDIAMAEEIMIRKKLEAGRSWDQIRADVFS